jgi:signal transduction histidine kinase
MGVIVMVLLAQDVPLASHLRQVETDRLLASLERDAFLIGGTAENLLSGEGGTNASAAAVQSTIDLYSANEGARVVVSDRNGIAVAVSDDQARVGGNFSTRPEFESALAGTPVSGRRYSNDLGEELAYVAVPVFSGAQVVGAVRITFPARVIDHRANDKVRGLIAVGLISMGAAAIAALFMAGTVVRPLRRLEHTTELVAAGDFSRRVDNDQGPPEVRRLADSFNTMTARVAELVEAQRSFAGDASHQLRTPLTALRLQLERAQELLDTDPAGARDRIEAAGTETERLQRLVEGLLLLARSDRPPTSTTVDVASVARERVEIWQPLAEEQGISLLLTAPASATAHAVPGAIEQIVDNYLDNAIGVSPAGSAIDVVVRAADGRVDVHVLDRGPGMTAEQVAHAFDRFWRAPDAPHEGSGLGLAIVRHLAQASGGQVTLVSRPEGGIDAGLTLRA